jgi:hypothetical protein
MHGQHVQTVAIVMPIAHKNSSIAAFPFGFGNIPIYEIFAVLIVQR